jgi:hypothetical protein
MKSSFGIKLVIVVLLVVLLFTLFSSSKKFQPYVKHSPFQTLHSNVEGYSGMRRQEYTTYPENQTIDSMNAFSIQDTTGKQNCKKVFGFSSLLCNPEGPENSFDSYSLEKGDISCIGKSSGMSKSTGALCMSDQQLGLLRTRGGNAVTGDATIGK